MRILHLGATYPPYHGGMGTVMKEQATRLAARGHEVVVATLALDGMPSGEVVEDGVRVIRCRAQVRWTRAGLAFSMLKLLTQESWDIVHLHAPFFGLQEAMALMLRGGWNPGRFVVTYHMDIVSSGFIKWVAALSRVAFLGTVMRRADVVICGSDSYAQSSWLSRWPEVLSKCITHPFGVDLERFTPGKGATGKTCQFLFVGGLDANHYFKGLEGAMIALSRATGPWRLTVVGEGDQRASFEDRARDLAIEDRTVFKGRVSDVLLPGMYQSADVLLFPSVDRSEAFGLVAVEAQACGTPVIASDLDGVRDVVVNEKTGWLVPPQDTRALAERIQLVLDDLENVRDMRSGVAASARERFDWNRHVDQLETQYTELCASSS